MSELFNVAFQNSTLDPEVKSSISAIASRITYGDDGKVIEELKNANEKLTGEIEGLKHELEGEPVVVEEPTITRTRR